MGKDIDEQQLLGYLVEFVTGMPIQCDRLRLVDLYGNKMPSQLFDTTTINHYHYVFTQLKKTKAGKGKLFYRRFVGGAWKGTSGSIPVYNKETSVFGFKKTFRFDEKHQSWYMTEYHLTDKILEDLRLRGQIRYEEFVVCRIRRNVNSNHIRENFLASSSSQGQETVKSFAQENQESSAANVIPSDELNSQVSLLPKESNVIQLPASIDEECSVPVVHQETPSASLLAKESNVPAAIEQEECSIHVVHQETLSVSLLVKESNVPASIDEECSVPVDHQETPPVSFVAKESNVPAEIEEECSVPVDHQENPSVSLVSKESNVGAGKEEEECSVRPDYDIATYHKELDAYAASVLETMVPHIPEQQADEDEIPLFCEDFYIGHTNLWR